MTFNPNLTPWKQPVPNKVAGKGLIQKPGEVQNLVWQTRSAEPTSYELSLSAALIEAFGSGAEERSEVVSHLNAQGVFSPNGSPWTEASFEQEMERLAQPC